MKEIIASRKTARRQSAALHEIERSQKVEDATALNKENWLEGLVAARRKERQDQERKHRECVVANDPQHRDYEVIMAEKKAEQESFEAFRRALSCHPGTYLERSTHALVMNILHTTTAMLILCCTAQTGSATLPSKGG